MKTDLYIASAVVAASMALVLFAFAPLAGAADRPAGATGTQPEQGLGAETMKGQPQVQRNVPVPGELGKGHERPMKMPDWIQISPSDDYSHLLNLDFKGQVPDILERTKEDDSKSTTAF